MPIQGKAESLVDGLSLHRGAVAFLAGLYGWFTAVAWCCRCNTLADGGPAEARIEVTARESARPPGNWVRF